ncbi:MAG: hypothetical protein D6813_08485 [Calditrichaeota bacterium]|nr:MAG: hypothetical protein D6813_08485 [Calditrichota bacterium]
MNTKIKTLIIILLAFLPLIGIFSKTVEQSPQSPVVTPVSGPSWLKRLGLRPGETAMGRMGGRSSAPPSIFMQPGENTPEPEKSFLGHMRNVLRNIFSLFKKNRKASQNLLQKTFILSGSDLYRLNCQSCHGPDGTGAPPEIKSLIDPVRGMSPTLIMKRMEERGRPIDEAFARELASQAEATLRQRLQEGGEKMPPFKHLSGDEVEALIEYLKELAGLPEEERHEIKVTQSVARVGEHLIKGTCHICHDATGPGGGHMAMMRGIIPSLASFVRQNSIQQVVRQVKMGSSRMMYMMGRDTMPAFPYLSEEEIIAGYLYLVEYPPRP